MNHRDTLIGHVLELQDLEDSMKGQINKISRAYNIPKVTSSLALQKISSAVQIIKGRNSDDKKILTAEDEAKLIELVSQLCKNRRFIFLMRKEDESGVIELLTGKEFSFR